MGFNAGQGHGGSYYSAVSNRQHINHVLIYSGARNHKSVNFMPSVPLMKYFSTILLAIVICCHGYAQSNKPVIDSLEKLLATQIDSSLVKTFNELTWLYRLVDQDK